MRDELNQGPALVSKGVDLVGVGDHRDIVVVDVCHLEDQPRQRPHSSYSHFKSDRKYPMDWRGAPWFEFGPVIHLVTPPKASGGVADQIQRVLLHAIWQIVSPPDLLGRMYLGMTAMAFVKDPGTVNTNDALMRMDYGIQHLRCTGMSIASNLYLGFNEAEVGLAFCVVTIGLS